MGGTLQTLSFDQIGDEELSAWKELRSANPDLDSPYFDPGFAEAVHVTGNPVRVAVSRDRLGRIIGLLAYHRNGSILRPAGWPGADFQGPILVPGQSLSPLALLTGGVRSFAFDHLVTSYQDSFHPWIESTQISPYIDVSGGFDTYLGRISRSGKDTFKQARRKVAQLERAHGAMRFTVSSLVLSDFERLIELKRTQYAATGARDYLADPTHRDLLAHLWMGEGSSLRGMLSTVHVGSQMLSAHFGLVSGNVLHWWFPVYNPAFSSYSPGWILLREVIAACPALGITRIDLGRGDDEYKRRLKTGETTVSQGLVTKSATHTVLRRVKTGFVDAVKASPAAPGLRRTVQALRARHR